MKPLLTLIVPSYNMEKYLDRCLSSLLVEEDQMDLFEVLVINDGSKDRTSEIGHGFESRFPGTFRVIDKENGHYGSCVNRGLKEANGTFVKVLDADDTLDTQVFGRFLNFLSQPDILARADVVLSGYSAVCESSSQRFDYPYSQYDGPVAPNGITTADRHEWFIHGLTYRTSLLTDNHYHQTEGVAYTDNEWAFIPMFFVHSIYKFDGLLYLYSTGRDGQSVEEAVHAKNLWMETKVIRNLVNHYADNPGLRYANKEFLRERLTTVLTHIYQLYLLTFKKFDLDIVPLYELDSLLKERAAEIYEMTERYSTRIAHIYFHPIRNWRHRKCFFTFVQSRLYHFAESLASMKNR